MVTAWVAVVLYVVGVVVTFGVRTALHRRATGDSGLRRPTGARPGDPQWWGQLLFVLALAGGAVFPLAAALRVVPTTAPPAGVTVAGVILALGGFVLVLVSQAAMGRSWRIGVDARERTALVTGGIFGAVRNPVFTGMVAAVAGLALLAPSWLALLTVVVLVVALQVQVRLVEEPYLRAVHGDAYRAYTARAGRFLPWIGRTSRPCVAG